jgi:hypothetical protein
VVNVLLNEIPFIDKLLSIYIKQNVCVSHAFRNRRTLPEGTGRGASRPCRPGFRVPGSPGIRFPGASQVLKEGGGGVKLVRRLTFRRGEGGR